MPQAVHELEFVRTDGDESLWPTNNKRIVDGDGHVNYMHPVPIEDEWAVRWRKGVAAGAANLLKLPGMCPSHDSEGSLSFSTLSRARLHFKGLARALSYVHSLQRPPRQPKVR